MDEIFWGPGSFHVNQNAVFYRDGVVYRAVRAEALAHWRAVAATPFYKRWLQEKKLIGTTEESMPAPVSSGDGEPWAGVLRHETIPFVSYPYEWCFGMLRDAALLHLDLIADALRDGVTVKDATPYNVQWFGASPNFIDVASLETSKPGQPWQGYRQFCQLFLFPLLLQAYRGAAFQPWLRSSLEGISPRECARLMSFRDRFRRGVWSHVLLQARLERYFSKPADQVKRDLERSGFQTELIASNIRGLQHLVQSLHWDAPSSAWSGYDDDCHYSAADRERKERFVREAIRAKPRRLVWDLGCNQGRFSQIAAEASDYVVAVDGDATAIEKLYRVLRSNKAKNILPLVMDLANPSPGQGWRGTERKSFMDRARPDLTLCLALTHHLLISANVPMAQWLQWLADAGPELVIEFATPDDPKVKILLGQKNIAYPDYTLDHFETLLGRYFNVLQRLPSESGMRYLYACAVKKR